jgi:hypothetical protein
MYCRVSGSGPNTRRSGLTCMNMTPRAPHLLILHVDMSYMYITMFQFDSELWILCGCDVRTFSIFIYFFRQKKHKKWVFARPINSSIRPTQEQRTSFIWSIWGRPYSPEETFPNCTYLSRNHGGMGLVSKIRLISELVHYSRPNEQLGKNTSGECALSIPH